LGREFLAIPGIVAGILATELHFHAVSALLCPEKSLEKSPEKKMEIATGITSAVATWSGSSQICRADIAGIFPEKQN
jgi:hypothetical protein